MSDAGTAIFNHDVKVGSGGKLMADTLNNQANSANIIYRTGSTTVVGNNATSLVVADAGNVGIGTSSPATNRKLHVVSTAQNQAKFERSGAATSHIEFDDSTTTNQPSMGGVGDNLTFNTAFTERVRIDSSGNLGIGETSPLGKLHVKSAESGASADGGADELVVEGSGDSGLSILSGATSYGNILFSDSGDAAAGRIRYEHNNNALNFGTNGSWDRFYINSAGNVGIGNTSPANKLAINGGLSIEGAAAAAISEGLLIDYSTNLARFLTYDSSTGSEIAFYTQPSGGSTAERVRIDDSGNVGIGENDPDSTLTVKGSGHTNFQVKSNSESTKAFIQTVQDTDIRIGSSTNHPVSFYQNSTERARIDSSGNVGIGTSSPSHKLHVQGTSNDTIDETKGTMKVQASGGNGMILGTIASSPYTSYIQSAYVQDTSLAQYNLALNPIGGNVGIGTTSPNRTLNLHVAANNSNFTQFTNSTTGEVGSNGFLVGIGSAGNAELWNYEAQPIIFATSSSERARINSGGDLLLGTSSGTAVKLNVQSSKANGLAAEIANTESSTGSGIVVKGGSSSSNYSADFRNYNSSSLMRVRGDGNVIIGGTSSNLSSVDRKFAVQGGDEYTAGFRGQNAGKEVVVIHNQTTGSSDRYMIEFKTGGGGGTGVGSIRSNSSSTSYNTSSDYRLKENVDYDFNALDRVAQLKPARFNFIADADTTVDGFLAHEVQDIVPEAISGEKDAVDENGDIKPQGIDQSKLVPLLTKAIQEQQEQIESLKSEIANLKGE